MLMLIVYEQWRGISFLGSHFSAVERGRKLCILILVCVVSAFLGLCWVVQVCCRRLIFLVLCRRSGYLSWGYWCPCWGHWPGCGYTVGKRSLTNVPWSWLFLGTIYPGRVPWWTLTVWSGCPPICVRIPVFLQKRKVCLPLVNFFICEMIVVFWRSTQTVFTGVSHIVTEYKSSLMMIYAQMRTGKRVVVVRHYVTLSFLTPFFCVRNVRETLSARRRIPLSWESSLRFL